MASVIYLDSSDEEDDPVPLTKPVDQYSVSNQAPNPSNLQQFKSLKPSTMKCKIETVGGVSIAPDRYVEDFNVNVRNNASSSTSDQTRDSMVNQAEEISKERKRMAITKITNTIKNMNNQAEERSKLTAGGKLKSAAAVAGPSNPTEDNLCRHFWQAGDYEGQVVMKRRPLQGAMDHVRVHPKFLHSNATSHKWALGAIAELLDNAVDEVSNGATYVRLDKITNARDGKPALLVQDNGGGMSPDNIRQCMSLGYSLKNKKTTIGQYGNGFKTSTMRLGADVIVFTRNRIGMKMTQSIGLLSYTFLRKTGHEDTVVPMLDYQLSSDGVKPSVLLRNSMDDWLSNLNTIIKWSPYSSEQELLRQFNDIGWHGTKVIIFNLWLNDDGILELDFDSDEHDIQLRVGSKDLPKQPSLPWVLAREHISNRYQLSLRVYASILYLEMPDNFQIILRGKPVDHHSIAGDLKFTEYIVYRPQIGPSREASVTTTIGFSKEAPMINVHGFNVYHRNRLIMPFWKVFQENSSRGRGVVGVLEANFIEPAHDKQDFERTSVFLRLESRLKAMTIEYWNLHSQLIGYKKTIRPKQGALPSQHEDTSTPNLVSSSSTPAAIAPVTMVLSPTSSCSSDQPRVKQFNGNNPASGPSTPPRAGVGTADVEGAAERSGNGSVVIDISVQRTTSGNKFPGKVKVEGVRNGEHSKRQRDQEDPLVESKRQRMTAEAVPLATRGAGDISLMTRDSNVILEQQVTALSQRCTEYELRERHLEQKLAECELRERNLEQKLAECELRERHWELKLKMHEQRERDAQLVKASFKSKNMELEIKNAMLTGQTQATEVQRNKSNGDHAGTNSMVKMEPKDLSG